VAKEIMPNASGRRYKQAIIGFKHLTPRQRPNYKKRDSAAAAAHNARVRQRENERNARKGQKAK
jgi:hypothetical protein